MIYVAFPFGDFESYFRIGRYLNEDDIQLISKLYRAEFVTHEIPPGIYSIKQISEIVYAKADRPGTLQLQHDDITMKTNSY